MITVICGALMNAKKSKEFALKIINLNTKFCLIHNPPAPLPIAALSKYLEPFAVLLFLNIEKIIFVNLLYSTRLLYLELSID